MPSRLAALSRPTSASTSLLLCWTVSTAPYDNKVLGWLAGLDDPTYRTVASLLWRCRLAGLPGETGPA